MQVRSDRPDLRMAETCDALNERAVEGVKRQDGPKT